jgi:hypothetical protein
MAKLTNPITGASQDQVPVTGLVDEVFVDQIWQEVQGKVSRLQIHQLVLEATSEFAEATITTYVPIFVRRHVHKKLASMLNDGESIGVQPIIYSASVEEANCEEEYRPTTGRFGQRLLIWLFQALL